MRFARWHSKPACSANRWRHLNGRIWGWTGTRSRRSRSGRGRGPARSSESPSGHTAILRRSRLKMARRRAASSHSMLSRSPFASERRREPRDWKAESPFQDLTRIRKVQRQPPRPQKIALMPAIGGHSARGARSAAKRGLPARPERVAEYLREVSETRGIYTIQGIRYAIRDAHRRAGHGDRCVSGHADAVIVDLRRRGLRFSPTSLDSESLEAIRAAATMLRLERPDWKTQRHTLVDVALCSVLHVSGLTVRQVVALKWRDVEMLGADSVRLTLRSTTDPHDIAATREIAGEVVRDLEAIRGNARPEDSVFGISYGGVYYRVRQIAEIAGLGVSSEAGPSHTPREGPPRTAQ